jgi:hypothetical protein
MSDELKELEERISQLSDDELIEMVTVSAHDYREEAVCFAKAELRRRDVDWSGLSAANTEDETERVVESEPPAQELPGGRSTRCLVCGGRLRPGTLVAEKELTIIFDDNREERFLRVTACVQCGLVSLVADFDTPVEP